MDRNGNLKLRLLKDKLFKISIIALALISVAPLVLILLYIAQRGLSVINWEFITSLPKPVGEKGGGILNALVGTVIIVGIASLLSIPPGIAAGIYMAEQEKSRISSIAKLCIEVLQSVPSIVIGIIAYVWVVMPMRGFSALAGGVALGIMMFPLVVRSTEETIKLIPESLKEAALALGVPYYRAILRVILPAGLSGILTGILVGIARIAGETAPLLFTAFGSPYLNINIFKPMSSLPLLIFNYATSPYEEWHKIAWGASFVLVMMILILNIIARVMAKRWKTRF
ncbi:MAG: phosphate ABC transporter permease PstA [Synergistetes bacterium]|nr:phosphate ABC transporter permease PstA [Synergistota bacterium]